MEWLFGFVSGFVADVVRSVFLPTSTEWLNKHIPSARKKANLEDNKLTLEVMERLRALGKDPALARHAGSNAETFLQLLESQQEAFVENAVEIIDSTHMTQLEMNHEAARRADVARHQMERAIIALERSDLLTPAESEALAVSQERWEAYAEAQSEVARLGYEGGSMASLVYWSNMETAAISRTGELRRMFEEMRELRG